MKRPSYRSLVKSIWNVFLFGSLRGKLLLLAGIVLLLLLSGTFVAFFVLHMPPGDAFWWSWTHILDPGFLGDDKLSWHQRIWGSCFSLLGLLIIGGAFITLAEEAATRTLERMSRGRVPPKMSSHTVIAGVGEKAAHFMDAVGKLPEPPGDHEIVVVVPDAAMLKRTRESCQNRCHVLVDEVWKQAAQKRLNLHAAKRLLILDNFGGDNGSMLKTIVDLSAARTNIYGDKAPWEMKVYAEVNNREILPSLQYAFRAFRKKEAKMEINLMNMADASARIALRENFLDRVPLRIGGSERVVLVILGWSEFGAALFQQALRVAYYPAKPTRVIIAGPVTPALKDQILEACPGLHQDKHLSADIMAVGFVPTETYRSFGLAETDIVTVAVCGGHPDRVFARGLHLAETKPPGLCQVYLELPNESGYRHILEKPPRHNPEYRRGEVRLVAVAPYAEDFELAENLDKDAEDAHRSYLSGLEEGERARSQDGKGYVDPSHYDWKDLDEIIRGWNRSPLDHTDIKIRALADRHGWPRPAEGGRNLDEALYKRISEIEAHARQEQYDEDVEFLSELEHNRWWGEKVAEGWIYAAEKDKARKRSPDLVPYELLSEQTKGYDRKQVAKHLERFLKRHS